MKVNYLAPATTADDRPVVVKVMIGARSFRHEAESLRRAGEGMVQLLEDDEETQSLLLERLLPGTPLAQVTDDDEATTIAAEVMRALWQPAPATHDLPTVAEKMGQLQLLRRRFDGGTGPIPEALVRQAESFLDRLRADEPPPTVVHGDLHHWNILRGERRPWLAIDPQGLVGDPGYEFGCFLGNNTEAPGRPWAETYSRRVQLLSQELDVPRERILRWAFVHAVRFAWEGLDDGHESGMRGNIEDAGNILRLL